MCAAGQGSGPINGPSLGFVQDSSGASIRPVLGIVGASLFGPPLALDSDVRNTVISPKQDYAIALRGVREPVLLQFNGGSAAAISLAALMPAADSFAISPSGAAVALYRQDTKTLMTISGLPASPAAVFQSDTSAIPGL